MENCSVFYYESQQACQVHGLVGTDDSSPYIRQIDVNTLDMQIAQVNAPERVCENSASTNSQLVKAMEVNLQSLKSLLRKSQVVNSA